MAGTVTQTWYELMHVNKVVLQVTFGTAGAFTAVELDSPIDGYLLRLTTDPEPSGLTGSGTVGPTDNYDITLLDDEAYDVLQGLGANRDEANTETVWLYRQLGAEATGDTRNRVPGIPVSYSDTLTLTIANNSLIDTSVTITLWWSLSV